MKKIISTFLAVLGCVSVVVQTVSAQTATDDKVIAIDVLLEPDQTMISGAGAINARLRGDYAAGYELDATHSPHVTLLQRFVRTKDFDAVTAAVTKVLVAERPTELQLKAQGLEYVVWGGLAVTAIVVERTPELMRLQQKIVDAVAPFSVNGGTASAFFGTDANAETMGWVEAFVPASSGEKYLPHVTAGVASEAFVKKMKAEPFEAFTFKPAGVAIYQLGNFGTAAAKLWQHQTSEPLASWNDGAAKQSIIEFVTRVTTEDSAYFVPVSERIATFDNDGTLWAEQPMYFQAFFIFDRITALAPQHPEWKDKEPFASVLKGDVKAVLAGGEHALLEMVMATHTGMTSEEFEKIVTDWITTAKHPKTGKLYTEMVYQPMLELLAYLHANGFKTFIVSGGGIEFMRPWAERVYGIPPEQVVGSSIKTKLELRDGKPVLVRLPEMNFIDDKAGKPVGIQQQIGRRPIAAFGNSDGDLQMLQWTAAGPSARFCLIVHHTDAEREWAYDRTSPIGTLDHALDEARRRGWTVVDMKKEWKQVFSFETK
jgi:phosphoserine phosphatase